MKLDEKKRGEAMSKHTPVEILPKGAQHVYYEQLLSLRRDNPRAWGVLSPAAKLTALQYESNLRQQAMFDEEKGI
jgi:hypothetical protein